MGKPTTIRSASTALTGSAVASLTVDLRRGDDVALSLVYTKGGSATAMQLVPQFSHDGATWYPGPAWLSAGSVSAGAVTITPAAPTYSFDTSGSYTLTFEGNGFRFFRVTVLETGTPGGTCEIIAATCDE